MDISKLNIDILRNQKYLKGKVTLNNEEFSYDFRNLLSDPDNSNISKEDLTLSQFSLSLYDRNNTIIKMGLPLVTTVSTLEKTVRLKGFIEYTSLNNQSFRFNIDQKFHETEKPQEIVIQSSITKYNLIESDEDVINYLIEIVNNLSARLSILEKQ